MTSHIYSKKTQLIVHILHTIETKLEVTVSKHIKTIIIDKHVVEIEDPQTEWLVHINNLGKIPVKKGLLNIKLINRPILK